MNSAGKTPDRLVSVIPGQLPLFDMPSTPEYVTGFTLRLSRQGRWILANDEEGDRAPEPADLRQGAHALNDFIDRQNDMALNAATPISKLRAKAQRDGLMR